jgi:serine/threonine-protein kinase
MVKIDPGSKTPTGLPFTGLKSPLGIAVETSGAVYVADQYNNRVVKVTAGFSSPTVLPFSNISFPKGIAVDSSGTVYITNNNQRVVMLTESGTQSTLPFKVSETISSGWRLIPLGMYMSPIKTIIAR